MNFKRILVAINHSPLTSIVFDRALHIAQQEQARLTILYCLFDVVGYNSAIASGGLYGVYPGFVEPLNNEIIQSEIQSEIQQAEDWLKECCQKATALNISTEYQQQFGEPGATILSVAHQWNADLIILGRHDRSKIAEFFTGSVSNDVVHQAHCSVLVIKDNITLTENPQLAVAQSQMSAQPLGLQAVGA